MLTAEGCAGRRARLWRALPEPCDWILVADPYHLAWLTSFWASPFSFRSTEAAAFLVMTPDRAMLVGDSVLGPDLDRAYADEVIAPVWYDARRSAPHRRGFVVAAARDALRAEAVGTIGVDVSAVPQALVHGDRGTRGVHKLVDLDPIIRKLRRAKDPDELAVIRRSIRAGEAGHAAALENLRPGMSELDAFDLVSRAVTGSLGEPGLVYGDFEAYPRPPGARPPSATRGLRSGDLFILDFSVIVAGYRADFANTIVIGGPPSAEHARILEGCLAALAAGESALRPGARGRDVDAAVRQALAAKGLDGQFPSHSGHGLGLGHPEPPYLVPESTDTLEVGDVVTLEPGQYGPEFSLRFERNYLITAEGCETLTHHRIALRP
jgi:Xaa-Pro aminopeptidase